MKDELKAWSHARCGDSFSVFWQISIIASSHWKDSMCTIRKASQNAHTKCTHKNINKIKTQRLNSKTKHLGIYFTDKSFQNDQKKITSATKWKADAMIVGAGVGGGVSWAHKTANPVFLHHRRKETHQCTSYMMLSHKRHCTCAASCHQYSKPDLLTMTKIQWLKHGHILQWASAPYGHV